MQKIYTVFIILSLIPMISSAANVKKYFIPIPTDIVVRKDFVETTVKVAVQDSVAAEKNEKKVIDCFTAKSNFMERNFSLGSHILVNMDEDELDLGINSSIRGLIRGKFRPAIIYDISSSRNFFGLVNVEDISRFVPDIGYSEIHTIGILNYPIPVEATVIYVICPPDRNGFCKVTMKAKGSPRTIELNAIAQSRLA